MNLVAAADQHPALLPLHVPRLPAFLTADAVKVLVDAYNLQPADEAHPEADVKKMMMMQ